MTETTQTPPAETPAPAVQNSFRDCEPYRALANRLTGYSAAAVVEGEPSEIIAALSEAASALRVLADTLVDANQQTQKAYAVAERGGVAVSWEAWRQELLVSLEKHRKVMFPICYEVKPDEKAA